MQLVSITDGVTTPISAGAPVTIVPSGNPRAIKSITLMDAVPPTITLDNTMTAWTPNTYDVPEGGLTFGNAIIGEGCTNCSAGTSGQAVAGTMTDNR